MPVRIVALSVIAMSFAGEGAAQSTLRSHPPMRPLPTASHRPLGKGPAYFVDASKGDDGSAGSEEKPWKTVGHAVKRLGAGDTLYLRGGIYYEAVLVNLSGTAQRPITIRSYPGELAVIDSGHREFYESPETAWEPVPNGGPDEYRSTKTYPMGGGFGNFADSMIPFHRYMNFHDLRSLNEFYLEALNNRGDDPTGMYCGPGVRRDPESGRIHIRLSHTQLPGLGANHYRGATDPRKLRLVITGHDYAVRLDNARHVRIFDIVVRGAQRSAVAIENCADIELNGLALFGSSMALRVSGVERLQLVNCVLRGHAAPWHSRFHHKNRAGAGYLVLAAGSDFEFAHCEFTDHHDAIQLHGVDGMRFHHNLVDNFNDDGLEIGPKRTRVNTHIYENYLSRCLNPFTAHADKPTLVDSEPGSGVYICRNIIDFREGTYGGPPRKDDPNPVLDRTTEWLDHDHGSPVHENYYVYHNTFLMAKGGARGYYAFTWAGHMRGAIRRVFNNIFVQVEGSPGVNFASVTADDDFQADGNLHWSLQEGPQVRDDVFAKFRQSPLFAASQKRYSPGWAAHDRVGDPRFAALAKKDFRLHKDSPAIDAGVPVPADWPDPLRKLDAGRPDIGAFSAGAAALKVGPQR